MVTTTTGAPSRKKARKDSGKPNPSLITTPIRSQSVQPEQHVDDNHVEARDRDRDDDDGRAEPEEGAEG